jgi:death-on-curing family protein
MAELFEKDRDTISEHIGNLFAEGELEESPTTRKFRAVQNEGTRKVERQITFYNLDVIISVGYRVKSQRGTQFRIWATNILKDHLVKGYTINQKRLDDLQTSIKLIKKATENNRIELDEAQGLLNVITEYTNTWILLNKYDEQQLDLHSSSIAINNLEYEKAVIAIKQLKTKLLETEEASELFGNEIQNKLKAILGTINQTFDNSELYPSIEEKAANLLYLIIKDHPFTDGNKRIGAFMFILFLDMNSFLNKPNGERKVNDNALTALSLLIAISEPKEKDIMIKLITNLLSEN